MLFFVVVFANAALTASPSTPSLPASTTRARPRHSSSNVGACDGGGRGERVSGSEGRHTGRMPKRGETTIDECWCWVGELRVSGAVEGGAPLARRVPRCPPWRAA
jgi:hypothetical protein